MIAEDEDALICDMAETYGILDFREIPVRTAAKLAVGLREDSRIKLKIAGMPCSMEQLLLAAIADRTATLVWFQSEDGQRGKNRPKSLVNVLLNKENDKEESAIVFASGQEFKEARKRIIEEVRANE